MSNVTELGLNTVDDTPAAEPNYHYTINFKKEYDLPPTEATGYIIVNQIFYGVARGDGVLYGVWPADTIQSVINNGPISSTIN